MSWIKLIAFALLGYECLTMACGSNKNCFFAEPTVYKKINLAFPVILGKPVMKKGLLHLKGFLE